MVRTSSRQLRQLLANKHCPLSSAAVLFPSVRPRTPSIPLPTINTVDSLRRAFASVTATISDHPWTAADDAALRRAITDFSSKPLSKTALFSAVAARASRITHKLRDNVAVAERYRTITTSKKQQPLSTTDPNVPVKSGTKPRPHQSTHKASTNPSSGIKRKQDHLVSEDLPVKKHKSDGSISRDVQLPAAEPTPRSGG